MATSEGSLELITNGPMSPYPLNAFVQYDTPIPVNAFVQYNHSIKFPRGGFLKNVVHVFTPCLSKKYEVKIKSSEK